MSDRAAAIDRKSSTTFLFAIAVPGLVSGLLYSSILLAFLFLVPVQLAFGRSGTRAGLKASGVSAGAILAVHGLRLALGGVFSIVAFAAIALPPLVFIAALLLMNASFWRGRAAPYKSIAIAAGCAIAAIPLFVILDRDASIAAYMEDRVRDFLAPLNSISAGDGYEASAFAAALDPKELVTSSIEALRNSYAAIILVLVAGSWRLGNRLSGVGSRGRDETPAIDQLRLPYPFLWAFLVSWSLVLAVKLAHTSAAATAFAWNCALALSVAYTAQGLGIATHLLKKWNMPRSLRICFAAIAVMALMTPTADLVVAIGLPLLGVTEIWIPYRKSKGAGA